MNARLVVRAIAVWVILATIKAELAIVWYLYVLFYWDFRSGGES